MNDNHFWSYILFLGLLGACSSKNEAPVVAPIEEFHASPETKKDLAEVGCEFKSLNITCADISPAEGRMATSDQIGSLREKQSQRLAVLSRLNREMSELDTAGFSPTKKTSFQTYRSILQRQYIVQTKALVQLASIEISTKTLQLQYPRGLEHEYQLDKMKAALDSVRSLEFLPSFDNQSDDEFTPSTLPIPDVVKSLFTDVLIQTFGHPLLQLETCDTCHFATSYVKATVYVSPNSITQILASKEYKKPLEVLRYIFTHEVSHIVHEIAAHPTFSSQDFVSINGLPSAYAPAPKNQQEADKLDLVQLRKTHAEVDVYTTLLLTRAQFKAWKDVESYLGREVTNADSKSATEANEANAAIDFENRLYTLIKTLKIEQPELSL